MAFVHFSQENGNKHHKKYLLTESELEGSGRASPSISVKIKDPPDNTLLTMFGPS